MGGQAEQNGVAGFGGEELVVVGLFSEVEVRDECVFEQMDAAITSEDQYWCPVRIDSHSLGKHLEQSGREHEAGAERDEISQRLGGGRAANEKEAAEIVGEARHEAEQQA
jgi:hypothetical protein